MTDHIDSFLRDENGAITMDWVALSAGLVGLALAAVAASQGGVDGLAAKIESSVSALDVE